MAGQSIIWVQNISIHAPREGSDDRVLAVAQQGRNISIHAPREGSDWSTKSTKSTKPHFYPRSPRGERPNGGTTDET